MKTQTPLTHPGDLPQGAASAQPASAPAAPHPNAHLVQLDITWEHKAANFARVEELLSTARVRPGDFILLPEMFDTGFSFNIEKNVDAKDETLGFLRKIAGRTGATVQGGRTLLSASGRGLNVASVVAPGGTGELARYAKRRLFSLSGEHERFEAGASLGLFPWQGLSVQPAVCYDLRFPELFREGLRAGAQMIALGACWPVARAHHWRALAIARAIENQCFVLACNRVGDDPPRTQLGLGLVPGLHYAGGSIAISPTGDVLGELNDQPRVLSVPIDVGALHAWRSKFGAWREA